jgi:Bacterial PH domain
VSYIEKHLIEGEMIVYSTRLHWIVLLGPILLSLLLGLPGLVLIGYYAAGSGKGNENSTYFSAAGGILVVVGLILFGIGLVKRNATEMTVTNRRIVVKVGMAARRTVEMLLSRVESIGVEESVAGRILGYGTVIVRGTGGTPESFDTIAHPLEFRTRVQEQIEKTK